MSKYRSLRYQNSLSVGNRLGRAVWGVAYLCLFRPTPRWALHGWRRAVLRLFGAKIGEGCRIDPSVKIWAPWNLRVGDYVAIAERCDIYNVAPIMIGSKAAVSQRSFLCTASHDISSLLRPLTHEPIIIGAHAWIAAEAMVLPGAQVGEGAVIAARGVLRGLAAPWTIYAGNPACQVGTRRLGSPSETLAKVSEEPQ